MLLDVAQFGLGKGTGTKGVKGVSEMGCRWVAGSWWTERLNG